MKKSLLLLFLIFLTLTVNAATQDDFIRAEYADQVFWTHRDLIDSDFVIGSDEFFYGASDGNVGMTFYIATKTDARNIRISLETRNENFTIVSVDIEGSRIVIPDQSTRRFNYPALIPLSNALTKITVHLQFDPVVVGILEEIDFIIMNQANQELERYDPFLSGFNFRQEATLNTSGIGLTGNIDRNHTIAFFILETNLLFWQEQTFNDGNGTTWTESDEVTELNFDIEEFNTDTNKALYHTLLTDTFDKSVNGKVFFYYGGINQDNSDGTAAYPNDYELILHGITLLDSSSNNISIPATGNPDANESFAILDAGGGIEFDGDDSLIPDNGGFPSGIRVSGSLLMWVQNDSVADSNPKIYRWDTGLEVFFNTTVDKWQGNIPCSGSLMFTSPIFQNVPIHFATTWEADNNGSFYTNGDLNQTVACGALSGDFTTDLGLFSRPNGTDFVQGIGDEIKVFNYQLSSDEIRLLFHAEDNNFVTFAAQQNIVPVVNILHPNGGESFDNTLIQNVDINFTIQDSDSNSFLVDINFSTQSTQGTGTVILQDINTDSATISCGSSDFSNPVTCTFVWDIDAVADNNLFILIDINDSINMTFDASDASFEIFTTPIAAPPSQGVGYERYFNPEDDRKDLIDENRFVNPELVGNQSGVLKRSEDLNNLILVMIILLVVIIGIGLFFIMRGQRGKK